MRVSQSVPQATLRPGESWPEFCSFLILHMSKNWVYQVPKMAILIGNVMINLEDPWGVHYFQTNPQQIAWNPSSWGVRLVTRCFSMPQHLVSWFLDAFSVVLDEPRLNAVGNRKQNASHSLLHIWNSRPNSDMFRNQAANSSSTPASNI